MKRLSLMMALLVGMAAPGFAADAVLKGFRGHVSVRPAATGQWVKATPGFELNEKDQVITGKNGAVQLSFANGATMLVKERSRFSMGVDRVGKLVKFRTGEFLIGLRKKLEGKDRFRVRTPVAVAAVRGTVFWGKSDKIDGTQFACFTGFIDVTAKGKKVTLLPGQATSIKPLEGPAEPAPSAIQMAYIQNFSVDGSLQGIDDQITAENAAPADAAQPEPVSPQ